MEKKLAYAAYVAYQIRAFFPEDKVDELDMRFNNIETMEAIAEIAMNHHINADSFYDDGYDDACKLFDKILEGD